MHLLTKKNVISLTLFRYRLRRIECRSQLAVKMRNYGTCDNDDLSNFKLFMNAGQNQLRWTNMCMCILSGKTYTTENGLSNRYWSIRWKQTQTHALKLRERNKNC